MPPGHAFQRKAYLSIHMEPGTSKFSVPVGDLFGTTSTGLNGRNIIFRRCQLTANMEVNGAGYTNPVYISVGSQGPIWTGDAVVNNTAPKLLRPNGTKTWSIHPPSATARSAFPVDGSGNGIVIEGYNGYTTPQTVSFEVTSNCWVLADSDINVITPARSALVPLAPTTPAESHKCNHMAGQ